GMPRLLLRSRQARLALALEGAEARLLALLVGSTVLERRLQSDEVVMLALYLIAELFHAAHQRAVPNGEQMQILVSRHQLAERPRGQHRLRGEERPALVDVGEPLVQR